ncbi:c-type cytochrome [Variovorax sp. LjRoot290]|uniref:c-type cytochrome n=1 Tax=Variovorax sp. LjRoot290 TaxID=3342316 RepID=UPI003ECF01D5
MTRTETSARAAIAALAALGWAGALHAQTPPAGDATRGKTVFARCAACHSVEGKTGIGPALNGVFGRVAGKAPGFRYSSSMAASTAPWDAASLEAFLAAPTRAFPGSSMPLNVPSAQDRADLGAYLRTLSAP